MGSVQKIDYGKLRRANLFDADQHLQQIMRRFAKSDQYQTDDGDNQLDGLEDLFNMAGRLAATDIQNTALANDQFGSFLGWQIGEFKLTDPQKELYDAAVQSDAALAEYTANLDADAAAAFRAATRKYIQDPTVLDALSFTDQHPDTALTRKVIIPDGTENTLRLLRENGLIGMTLPQKYEGMGVPAVAEGVVGLLINEGDSSLIGPYLTSGVAELIEKEGSSDQKEKYIPRLVSTDPLNAATGAMLLTESGAGSDLPNLKMQAERVGDQTWLTGEKIFISNARAVETGGLMAVIARAPGHRGDKTTKTIDLYIVEGNSDAPEMEVSRTEDHKMGIKASDTGTIYFDRALGDRIGEEGAGFMGMTRLMNRERLAVGMQGIAIAKASILADLEYISTRQQFDAPLESLPVMQRTVFDVITKTEGATSLLMDSYAMLDRVNQTGDRADLSILRVQASLAKYAGSRLSLEVTDRSLLNHGGSGYVQGDQDVALRVRNARILQNYEGTDDIHAIQILKGVADPSKYAAVSSYITGKMSDVTDDDLVGYRTRVEEFGKQIEGDLLQILTDASQVIDSDADDAATQMALLSYVGQDRAKKLTDDLVTFYQAALMLDEAQDEITAEGQFRKAAMARHYIETEMGVNGNAPGHFATGFSGAQMFYDQVVHYTGLDKATFDNGPQLVRQKALDLKETSRAV